MFDSGEYRQLLWNLTLSAVLEECRDENLRALAVGLWPGEVSILMLSCSPLAQRYQALAVATAAACGMRQSGRKTKVTDGSRGS